MIAAVTLPSMPPGFVRQLDAEGQRELCGGGGHRGRASDRVRRRVDTISAVAADAPRELFLIDGNSLVYRAFFALPETIATSKGEPTNAIFGFASMLVKILTEYGVEADAGGLGRRHVGPRGDLRRSTRPAAASAPDLLSEQWPHMHPLVDALRLREREGRRLRGRRRDRHARRRRRASEGIDVMVVTGDRDLFQLIEPGVRVMATSRGITETKIYDREAVIDRYGIPPELIPDFVGLKGDTSDNIPGVPGIGDKTASQLLQEWGDLEGVLANIDKISGAKRKENLTEHAEDARVSKQLATAMRDVDVDVDLDAGDRARARPLAAARDVPRVRAARPAAAPRGGARRGRRGARRARGRADRGRGARGAAGRARRARRRAGRDRRAAAGRGPRRGVAPRRRPSSTRSWRPRRTPRSRRSSRRCPSPRPTRPRRRARSTSTAARAGRSRSPPGRATRCSSAEAETLAAFALARGEQPVVAHDWKTIAMADDACDAPPLAHDTMVAAYLIDPARRGYPLDELATEARASARAAVDGRATAWPSAPCSRGVLAERQRDRLEEDGLDRPVPRDRAAAGRRAGRDGARRRSSSTSSACAQISEALRRARDRARAARSGSWRARSSRSARRSSSRRSCSRSSGCRASAAARPASRPTPACSQAIRDEHEIVPAIEEWRELTKLKSTYLDALPRADRRRRPPAHDLQPDGGHHRAGCRAPTRTSRTSRSAPSRAARSAPASSPSAGTRLISADYSQVELRLLAHIADEPVLKDIFRRGEDVHTATAEAILGGKTDPGTRSKAKMVNYGIVYGLSAFGLADRLQIEQEEAQQFIDAYLERFPKVKRVHRRDDRAGHATEGHVATLFGRIRRVPELRSRQFQTRSLGERLAVNMVIQGTAADIIKVAMVRARDELRDAGLETRLVLQIHDELLFEGPEDEVEAASEIVRREMAGAFEMDPPLEVDVGVGENWLEAK